MNQIINDLVSRMTTEEKAALCSGNSYLETKPLLHLGISAIAMSDDSRTSTCFPAACLSSCSFDRKLLKKMGKAIAIEALHDNVAIIPGPGVSIKRSPLCGSNFKYFSEDPYLTGELAAAIIDGIQSQNVSASIKYYAANNQEKAGFVFDSLVDERALREIYLYGFEAAIKKAKPQTLLCSYNKINGTYMTYSKRYLTRILRKEWGYKGVTLGAWGSCSNRVKALNAGLDLEISSFDNMIEKKIVDAVKSGILNEKVLDNSVKRLLALILSKKDNPKKVPYDVAAHNNLAREVAAESAVLLKNDTILPISPAQKIALIGAFAKTPRYKGGGSRQKSTMLCSAYDELVNAGVEFTYAQGYSHNFDKPAEMLLNEAKKAVIGCDVVLLYVGLPELFELENFDRATLELPTTQAKLINEITKLNSNTVVVLHCGSVVAMPWIHDVRSVLLMYLAGQAGGAASVDLLLGRKSPGGKLSETFPLSLSDTPSYQHFGDRRSVEYRESIYVGYRYYDKANRDVLFPFGFGLSYTSFTYSKLRLSLNILYDSQELLVTVNIKNSGNVDAKEIVQLYVKPPESKIFKAVRELKGFASVFLKARESKDVTFALNNRSFAYYNVKLKNWHVESGTYTIEIAASSRDIRLTKTVELISNNPEVEVPDYRNKSPIYYNVPKNGFSVPLKDFLHIYNKLLPNYPKNAEVVTIDSTFSELSNRRLGRLLYKITRLYALTILVLPANTKSVQSNELQEQLNTTITAKTMEILVSAMLSDVPLHSLNMLSNGILTMDMIEGFVYLLNGNYIKAVKKFVQIES